MEKQPMGANDELILGCDMGIKLYIRLFILMLW
jgi:hypothetical protein